MTESPNPAAPHHMPFFITAPGETDVLFVAMLVLLLVIVLILGNLYFQLHSLPDRIAHRSNPGQMQLVAVLTLIALFTHNNLFWIAALLLAFIQFPDFSSPMNSIARSLERLTMGSEPPSALTAPTPPPPAPPIEAKPLKTVVSEPRGDAAERGPNNA
jgi:hypothetical protein